MRQRSPSRRRRRPVRQQRTGQAHAACVRVPVRRRRRAGPRIRLGAGADVAAPPRRDAAQVGPPLGTRREGRGPPPTAPSTSASAHAATGPIGQSSPAGRSAFRTTRSRSHRGGLTRSTPDRRSPILRLGVVSGTTSAPLRGLSEELRTFVEEMPWERRSILQFVREVADGLSAGAVIVDIGAGDAPYRELFDHCEYIATDWAESVHEYAGEADVVAPAQALPLRSGSADAVLLTQVLEHVADPDACSREAGSRAEAAVRAYSRPCRSCGSCTSFRMTTGASRRPRSTSARAGGICGDRGRAAHDCFTTLAQLTAQRLLGDGEGAGRPRPRARARRRAARLSSPSAWPSCRRWTSSGASRWAGRRPPSAARSMRGMTVAFRCCTSARGSTSAARTRARSTGFGSSTGVASAPSLITTQPRPNRRLAEVIPLRRGDLGSAGPDGRQRVRALHPDLPPHAQGDASFTS